LWKFAENLAEIPGRLTSNGIAKASVAVEQVRNFECYRLFSEVGMEHNVAVSRRAWAVFGAIQAIGCIFAGYGTVYSESVFVRGSWLIGFFILLPGNLPAIRLVRC
jgi:hypothetical protein